MPDPTIALIGGSALLGSSIIGSRSANRAAGIQAGAANAAAQAQLQMYYQSREDLAPWREAGIWALNQLVGYDVPLTEEDETAIKGLGPARKDISNVIGLMMERAPQATAGIPGEARAGETLRVPGAMGPGGFQESPSYKFRQAEGLKGIERLASASGRLGSGASMKAGARYSSDLASQEWGNWVAQLMQIAGLGGGAAGQTAQNALSTGGALGQYYMAGGQAGAAGAMGRAMPYGNLLGWGGGNILNYLMMKDLLG